MIGDGPQGVQPTYPSIREDMRERVNGPCEAYGSRLGGGRVQTRIVESAPPLARAQARKSTTGGYAEVSRISRGARAARDAAKPLCHEPLSRGRRASAGRGDARPEHELVLGG